MLPPATPVAMRFQGLSIRSFSFPGEYELNLHADTPKDRVEFGTTAPDEVVLTVVAPDKRFPPEEDEKPRVFRWRSEAVGFLSEEMSRGELPSQKAVLSTLRHAISNSPLAEPGRAFLREVVDHEPSTFISSVKHWVGNVALKYVDGDLREVQDHNTRFTTLLNDRGETRSIAYIPPTGDTQPRIPYTRREDGLEVTRPLVPGSTPDDPEVDLRYKVPEFPESWDPKAHRFDRTRDSHQLTWQHTPGALQLLDRIHRGLPLDAKVEDLQADIDPREWALFHSLPEPPNSQHKPPTA
jgi:hypothetical protein